MADDRLEGKVDEMKGRGREAIGDLTGDEEQKSKGQAEQTGGKAKQVVGDIKNAIKDATGK